MTRSNLNLITVCTCGNDVDYKTDGIAVTGKVVVYRCKQCKSIGRNVLYKIPSRQKVDNSLKVENLRLEIELLSQVIDRLKKQ